MRNKVLSLVLLLVTASILPALELQRGKLKVVVNERTGRFVVWGAEDPAKPVWIPLFLSDDPTTSKWKLLVGDKAVVLGDDPSFTTAVEPTAAGAKVTWTGKSLVATLSFDFLISSSESVANGLRLGFAVTNVSDIGLKVGVRWVLDTNLGEKKDHFRLSSGEGVTSETKLEGSLPDSWVSRPAAEDQPGLLVMAGKGPTPPSRVIFANWKRLDDAVWDPSFKANRDFNLLPYSFNDSAAAQFYDPQDLASGASREITVQMGLASAKTFVGSRVGSANPIDDLLKKNQNPALSTLDQDLQSLDTLAAQLDAKLADPAKVSAEDLRLLAAVLDQIEARRKALEAPTP